MQCAHSEYKKIPEFDKMPLYRCGECGIVFSSLLKKPIDQIRKYEDYYRNELNKIVRFKFGVERLVKFFRFWRAFKIFTVYPTAKSIFDIGCGRGLTLHYLKKYYRYSRAAGTQLSKNAYEFCRDKLNLEVYNKDLLDLPMNVRGFDVVTIWHVLEHVPDSKRYIDKIYELLNHHGKLIIEVPNFDSWSRAITSSYWLSTDPAYHMTFFTPESLSSLLRKSRFTIKTVQTFSLEYSTFTSAQSLASRFTKSPSIFFNFLQTGKFNYALIPHLLILMLLIPISLFINLVLYPSKRGEVLFIIARKD